MRTLRLALGMSALLTTACVSAPLGAQGQTGAELDRDRLRDANHDLAEPNLRGLNGLPYDPGLFDTNGDGYRDGEDYACVAEATWVIGSHDDIDWAKPGHQTAR